ncbi:hypothetical protein RW110999_013 [Cyanophage S-RIM4]|nr:hypothetical protein RW110999_013 [Cyanophage S-RIM4]
MAMSRETANDVDFSLKVYREISGNKPKYLTAKNDGDAEASELADFVIALNVIESLSSSAIRAEITIQDSAGLVNHLKGGEFWRMTFKTGNTDATYDLVGYNISSRSRSGNSEVYIVECVSQDFLFNEVKNVFGSSKQLFQKKAKAKDVVTKLLKDKEYLKTSANLHIEDSENTHEFMVPNWRIFDTIHWIAQKSIRPGTASSPQNGFLFWRSSLGYHFKSIDKMIDEANQQTFEQVTDPKSGKARLYRYTYEPKKSDDEGNDDFRIDNITFPEDKNYLLALRNGSFAGYSTAFDINVFSNSSINPNTFSPIVYTFDKKGIDKSGKNPKVIDFWNKMSHIGGKVNPAIRFPDFVKQLVSRPKRIRFGALPNRIFDEKKGKDKQQYSDLAYMQAYQHIRKTTLQNIQLLVKIPGNLDLYPGYGIDIVIPMTKPSEDQIVKDRQYSGKYIIAAVRHIYDTNSLVTECLLYRDALTKE